MKPLKRGAAGSCVDAMVRCFCLGAVIDLSFALKEHNHQGIFHHLAWLIAALEDAGYIPEGLFQGGTAESAAKLQKARDVCQETRRQAAPDLTTAISYERQKPHISEQNEIGRHVPETPTEE
jgi:hypothetical protein